MRFGSQGLSKAFIEFVCLRSSTLRGKLNDLEDCFPSSLTELNLESCVLTKDPSHELECLPYLKELRLRQAPYLGKEMHFFSTEGFVQLQFLQLHEMVLEEWSVQEGAITSLNLFLKMCRSPLCVSL
ncbi:hypothetical protein IFM89_028770 [Coptis chinensis]|uniref:Uncharacterized protein n=1 Tax=Coptis chinensis TaxID=261450 RepID=A0A835GYI1_9MAGN|nr:hypothetical protein IFM89_028770 [Coptis chinensis]